MNLVDVAIIAVIALAVFFAIRFILKGRKTGCSCGCAECDRACAAAHKKSR